MRREIGTVRWTTPNTFCINLQFTFYIVVIDVSHWTEQPFAMMWRKVNATLSRQCGTFVCSRLSIARHIASIQHTQPIKAQSFVSHCCLANRFVPRGDSVKNWWLYYRWWCRRPIEPPHWSRIEQRMQSHRFVEFLFSILQLQYSWNFVFTCEYGDTSQIKFSAHE